MGISPWIIWGQAGSKIVCKKICSLDVKQVIFPSLYLKGMTSQRKSVKKRNHQNLPESQLPWYAGYQNQKRGIQRITFCSKAFLFIVFGTNTGHDIAHNFKTTNNTGIDKYSQHQALRHTIYQGILQIQE